MASDATTDDSNLRCTRNRFMVDWFSSRIPDSLNRKWPYFVRCATIGTLDNEEDEQKT